MIMQVRKFGLCGFKDFLILAQPNYYAGGWKKRKKIKIFLKRLQCRPIYMVYLSSSHIYLSSSIDLK
jgi:hypothetical protein